MTNSTTPTETVEQIILDMLHRGEISPAGYDNAAEVSPEAKSALRKAFESAMEAVIGTYVEHADYCCLKRSYFNMEDVACDCDSRPINEEKKAQHQRAKEQIKLMFGE